MGKLPKILSNWPSGTVAVQAWLEEQGAYRQLSQKYVHGGWINKIGHGVFVRAGDLVTWQGGIFALQQELKLPIHIGGRSALEQLGRAHFIPMAKQQQLYIYTHSANAARNLPQWFVRHFTDQIPVYINKKLFSDQEGLQELKFASFAITISGIERALFEVLALVPKVVSLQHAYLLFQTQDNLRTSVVQNLLNTCQIALVVRLFLYLAKKCQLTVMERINLTKANIGKGVRRLGEASYYDPDLKLYLPNLVVDEDLEF